MLRTPIIPERNATLLPPKPARKLRPHLPLKQVLQQRLALLLAPALESCRMRYINVQRLPSRLGVCPHNGVAGLVVLGRYLLPGVLDAVFARLGGVGFFTRVYPAEGRQRLL